jgi:hypothetical protein
MAGKIKMMTTVGEITYSLRFDKPIEPTVGSSLYDHKMMLHSIDNVKWK